MKFGLSPKHVEILKRHLMSLMPSLTRVDVFGSRAQSHFRPNSDLDLVLYGSVSSAQEARLMTELADSALPMTVDVVTYDRIEHRPLKDHIDAVGQTLLSPVDFGASR